MKLKIIISGCILIAGSFSCEKETKENNGKIEVFKIKYVRGSAWVDFYHSVILDQSGTMQVIYHHGLPNIHRENNYQINDTDIVKLKDNLILLSSIKLKERYGFGPGKPYDLPVTRFRYDSNIKSDSTLIYLPEENELPSQLVSFSIVLNK